jgi:peptidoglycan/LPS O-acetylase OafA/YrhL
MAPRFVDTKDRFRNLDAMRGVCAMSVVLFHADGLFVKGEIFCHGFLAVDVFFILSGFVLAHTYENRLAAGLTARAFAWLRVKRLAPVYWTGTLLGTLTLIAITAAHPGAYYSPLQVAALSAMAMLLIPQLTLRGTAYPANAVAWSLAGEMIVNLLYARWLHRWSNRALLLMVIAGWGASTAYAYLGKYGWCFGARPSDVLLTPLRAIPGFLAGVLMFRAHRKGWLAKLPKISPLAVLALWGLIAEVPTHGATPTFDTIVVVVLSPLMIALLVRAPDEAPKPFLWLGSVSYALYSSHLAIVYLAGNTPIFGLDTGPSLWRAALVVAGTVGLAGLIHALIEQTGPLRAFKTAASG